MGSCPDTDIDPKNLSETFCSRMYEANHDFFCHYCPVSSLTNIIINNKFHSKYYHHHCLIFLHISLSLLTLFNLLSVVLQSI